MAENTVLIVDDDEAIVRLIRRVLEKGGYQVLSALNGAEALLLCDEHKGDIQVVLLDVIMPGLKGDDFEVYFKSKHPEAKVIFMSGYSEEILAAHKLTGSEENFLKKPFTLDELLYKVEEVMKAG